MQILDKKINHKWEMLVTLYNKVNFVNLLTLLMH